MVHAGKDRSLTAGLNSKVHIKYVFVGKVVGGKMRTIPMPEPPSPSTSSKHAVIQVLYEILPSKKIRFVAVPRRERDRNYDIWTFPTESSESKESPLGTAEACVDHEVAEQPGTLQVELERDPIAEIRVPLTERSQAEQGGEIIGPPEWVEGTELYLRMLSRGKKPHQIVALFKAVDHIGEIRPDIGIANSTLWLALEAYVRTNGLCEAPD